MRFLFLLLMALFIICHVYQAEAQARDPIPDSMIVEPTKWVFTVGVLQGGSIIGIDAELRLFDGVGFQLGSGVFGYSTGLNFHFKNDINSPFVSLQYVHQGLGKMFVQSMFGPAYVHRWENGLSGQIGVGFLSGYGRKWGNNFSDNVPPAILPMIALGYCFRN
ncbi:MAG: hypothetical protein ACFHWX_21930 [Bacteroidota bacterium]